jgi:hypothetical protein
MPRAAILRSGFWLHEQQAMNVRSRMVAATFSSPVARRDLLLIKQVVEELKADFPQLKRFSTLSSVPGFRRWLSQHLADANDLDEHYYRNSKVMGGGVIRR